ncbi:substrate-binding domain-containing protein [soil metagenome]
MMKICSTLLLLTALLYCTSCGTDFKKPYSDTPTAGKVKISSDETLKPFIDAEKDTFMGLYRYAELNVSHQSESECFRSLLDDSAKVIISTRKLLPNEEKFFKSKNLFPITTKIAVDALALIINKENKDSLMQFISLKEILSGKINSWKQINPSSPLGEINLVFDNNGSSNVRFLQDSVMKGNAFPSNCFAVKSNESVIDYVEKNKNAIGVIGVAWISDGDDPVSKKFLNRVTVVELATIPNPVFPDDYYKPYQAYIALGQYPMIREVYMINREGRMGLGTGFVSFVAGDAGQRVTRLAGLLPATMPVRIIQTK